MPADAPVKNGTGLPIQHTNISNLNLGVHTVAPVGDNIGVLVQNANVPNFNLGAPAGNHINEQLQEVPKNTSSSIDPDKNDPDFAFWGLPSVPEFPDDIFLNIALGDTSDNFDPFGDI